MQSNDATSKCRLSLIVHSVDSKRTRNGLTITPRIAADVSQVHAVKLTLRQDMEASFMPIRSIFENAHPPQIRPYPTESYLVDQSGSQQTIVTSLILGNTKSGRIDSVWKFSYSTD